MLVSVHGAKLCYHLMIVVTYTHLMRLDHYSKNLKWFSIPETKCAPQI